MAGFKAVSSVSFFDWLSQNSSQPCVLIVRRFSYTATMNVKAILKCESKYVLILTTNYLHLVDELND